jgi:hypothetical protein
MRSILVTGVTAAGKSTVGAQAARRLGMASHDYADLMLKAEPELGDKDAIEALPWGRRRAQPSAGDSRDNSCMTVYGCGCHRCGAVPSGCAGPARANPAAGRT